MNVVKDAWLDCLSLDPPSMPTSNGMREKSLESYKWNKEKVWNLKSGTKKMFGILREEFSTCQSIANPKVVGPKFVKENFEILEKIDRTNCEEIYGR